MSEPFNIERRLDFLENELTITTLDLQNAELALRSERRKVTTLRAQLQHFRTVDPKKADVVEVFEHWKAKCNKPRAKLGAARHDAVAKMLRLGFTVAELCKAVDGAERHAYVNDAGKVFDDLELICRNEVKVERFIALAEDVPGAQPSGPGYTAPDPWAELSDVLHEALGAPEVDILGAMTWECPVCSVAGALALDVEHLGCRACGAGPTTVIPRLQELAA